MRRVPSIGADLTQYQSQVAELINKLQVFLTAPSLEEMEIGEIALGDGTEASPAAGSDALYFRPDSSKIVVISSNGSSLATRTIT
jgi:hypothetical protein